ncbi:XRE family transcriptional regulator [Clostridiaceae bacterium]|nr:helix-turn-helix transcriptional regulator [Lachnospiraceae bacterium]MCI9560586.1 helix-turn-helix transcriptional regulator [Lachnospiraceae bacterium]NBH20350.1 XRE family transcriptional regulator [Clostridiaceae bacterium]
MRKYIKWQERYDSEFDKEQLRKKIGESIAEWRKCQEMSQEEIAHVLKVSKNAVGKWERGESMPPIDKSVILSELSGVSLDSMLLGRVPMVDKKIQERLENVSYKNKENLLKIIVTFLEAVKNT